MRKRNPSNPDQSFPIGLVVAQVNDDYHCTLLTYRVPMENGLQMIEEEGGVFICKERKEEMQE